MGTHRLVCLVWAKSGGEVYTVGRSAALRRLHKCNTRRVALSLSRRRTVRIFSAAVQIRIIVTPHSEGSVRARTLGPIYSLTAGLN